MNKLRKLLTWIFLLSFSFISMPTICLAWGRYSQSLQEATEGIMSHLTPAATQVEESDGVTVSNAVFGLLDDVVIPVVIVIWIVVGSFWTYKLLFSSDEKEIANWMKMLIFWVIWIILMVSARYLWKVLFVDIFSEWNVPLDQGAFNWIKLSTDLYEKIAYPFIKIVLYLALFIIFVVLLGKSIKLFTKSDWSNQKESIAMIWWAAVSILVIIWAKTIVEAIYGKQADVLNSVNNLWEIWTWILADRNIPLIYTILNRVVWLISLVIFILFLVQWFKILLSPSKAENVQRLWKNILYTVIWLLVIWAVYLLTNVLIIN